MQSLNRQLLSAIINGKASKIEKLVAKGADPNGMPEEDSSYISKNWSFLMIAARFGPLAVIEALVKCGADVNFKTNSSHTTPLLMAANYGDKASLECLINHGAEINAEDVFGYTALINICRYYNSEVETIEYLLNHGARINRQDKNGFTPFMCAATANKNHEVLLCLIRHGADLTIKNHEGNTVMDILVKREEHDMYNFLKQVTENQTLDKLIENSAETTDGVAF